MNYRAYIGEKVIRYDGEKGIIKDVDRFGFIKIEYENDIFAGSYMYDPFLNEDVRFENEEIQKEIDDKLAEINNKNLELINSSLAAKKEDENFYITMDNEDGSRETIYSLKCDLDSAHRVFSYAVKEQQKVYRRLNTKWRVVRLFDSKTNKQIAQES